MTSDLSSLTKPASDSLNHDKRASRTLNNNVKSDYPRVDGEEMHRGNNNSNDSSDDNAEKIVNEKTAYEKRPKEGSSASMMLGSFSLPSFKSSLLSNMANRFNDDTSDNQADKSNPILNKLTEDANQTAQTSVPQITTSFQSSLLSKSSHSKINDKINDKVNNNDVNVFDQNSQNSLSKSLALLSQSQPTDETQPLNLHSGNQLATNKGTEAPANINNSTTATSITGTLTTTASNKIPHFDSLFSNSSTKFVRLPNGNEIKLKPKTKSIFDKPPETINLKKSYGIDIHQIYRDMDLRSKLCSTVTSKTKKRRNRGILWVEKWRPKSFLDLVGNEKANRLALRWLRHWSTAVYGEDIAEELSKLPSNKYKAAQAAAAAGDSSKFEITDPFNRPTKRILLLHGPPGIGKTTIAHLIAKQLKYDSLEINASDERAGQQVRDKIYNALDTHTFSGNPTCIIADEIDGGSESGFIRVLTELIYKDIRATKNLIYSHSQGKKNQTKTQDRFLLRPIIAICNDLYSPVLEKLRPHCEIISFKKPSENLIKDRLSAICKSEKLNIGSKELTQVVAIANSDIRSCLNLLQFNGEQLTDDGELQQVRTKDTNLTWFKLVNMMFQLNLQETKHETFYRLQQHLDSNSSVDKIVNGCFQVYPETVYNDPALLKRSVEVADWLYFYDIMQESKYQQNGELVYYANQVPLKFYQLFAEANKDNIKHIHNSSWEYYELQRLNSSICERAIISNTALKPSTFSLLNKKQYVGTEILPILNNYIFNPSFTDRNNVILNNANDKKKIAHLLDLLTEFNFTIENTDNSQGLKALALIPVMDSVTLYEEQNNQFKSIDSKRQMLLKYLVLEKERQKSAKQAQKRKFEETQTVEEGKQIETNSNKVVKNNGSVDFFKSSYASVKGDQPAGVNSGNGPQPKESHELKVWVKYHEGFSNAVRKNVSWSELWLN